MQTSNFSGSVQYVGWYPPPSLPAQFFLLFLRMMLPLLLLSIQQKDNPNEQKR